MLVLIIAVLTAFFIASATSGIARGVQWLSNINMVLALSLVVFVFIVGPTIFMLDLFPAAIGDYTRNLTDMSTRTQASGGDATAAWLSGWTVFYWAWWISWTPFVGISPRGSAVGARFGSSSPVCSWCLASSVLSGSSCSVGPQLTLSALREA